MNHCLQTVGTENIINKHGTKIKKAEIIAVTNENSHFSSSCEDIPIVARELRQAPPATSVSPTNVHNLLPQMFGDH
jgi:hypothetical protein